MGNRATVVFFDKNGYSPAIYLHWQGGAESIYRFLDELARRQSAEKYGQKPDRVYYGSADYAAARFCQIVGEFCNHDDPNDCMSLGLANGPVDDSPDELDAIETDHGDNGLYLVPTDPDKPLRRFLEKRTGPNDDPVWKFVEQTPEWVAAEKHAADLDPGYCGITETLQELAHWRQSHSDKTEKAAQV